jgi:hypothetical protein
MSGAAGQRPAAQLRVERTGDLQLRSSSSANRSVRLRSYFCDSRWLSLTASISCAVTRIWSLDFCTLRPAHSGRRDPSPPPAAPLTCRDRPGLRCARSRKGRGSAPARRGGCRSVRRPGSPVPGRRSNWRTEARRSTACRAAPVAQRVLQPRSAPDQETQLWTDTEFAPVAPKVTVKF